MIRRRKLNEGHLQSKDEDAFEDDLSSMLSYGQEMNVDKLSHDLSLYRTGVIKDISYAILGMEEDEGITYRGASWGDNLYRVIEFEFSRDNKQPADADYCSRLQSEIRKEIYAIRSDDDYRIRSLLQGGGIRLGLFIGEVEVESSDVKHYFKIIFTLEPIWEKMLL